MYLGPVYLLIFYLLQILFLLQSNIKAFEEAFRPTDFMLVVMEGGLNALCAGCLCAGRALREVASPPYEGFFKHLLAGESWMAMDARALRVCWECSALIRRLTLFREQVQLSCATLYDYLQRESSEHRVPLLSKPPHLQICTVHNITYVPSSSSVELEIVKQEAEESDNFDTEYMKDESDSSCSPADPNGVVKEETDTFDTEVMKNDTSPTTPTDTRSVLNNFKSRVHRKVKGVDVKRHKRKLKKKREHDNAQLVLKVKRMKRKGLKTVELLDDELEETDNGGNKTKSGKERLRRSVKLDPAKIKKIVLTPEELLMERTDDARSEAYLKLPHKCETCIQGFDHEETLNDHMGRKHNSALGKYQCDTCKSFLSSHASYSTHCRRHLLRFECAACGKRTVDKGAMMKHYGSEHEARVTQYTCHTCGIVSESYRAHRYHREKHQEKPQCEDCGKTFTNKNSLRCHILNMHRAERTYPCQHCDKTYRGKSGLLMHMSTHDAGARALAYCAPCRTHFKTLYNYRHHVRTSRKHRTDDDLTFVCAECEARFLTQRKLLEHVDWDHRNTSEHQCALCSKRFKHRVGLERHRKFVHEKQRPPRNKMCHHCGRGFTTASILRAHIRTHTGERPLACGACPATFSHSAALYTHNKLVHRKGEPPADGASAQPPAER